MEQTQSLENTTSHSLTDLKAEAYDLIAIIQYHENQVNQYNNAHIVPNKKRLGELNEKIAQHIKAVEQPTQ